MRTDETIQPNLRAALLVGHCFARWPFGSEGADDEPRPPSRLPVVVRDLSTQQDLGTVPPVARSRAAGSHLRLIMTAIPTGNRGALSGTTTAIVPRRRAHHPSRSENSTADLDVAGQGPPQPGDGYQIQEDWVPPTCEMESSISRSLPPRARGEFHADRSARAGDHPHALSGHSPARSNPGRRAQSTHRSRRL